MVRKARGKEAVQPGESVPLPGPTGLPSTAAHVIDDSLDGSMLSAGDEGNSLFSSVKKGRAALQVRIKSLDMNLINYSFIHLF